MAVSSSTRVEWILADPGAMGAGAAATAVHPSTHAEETVYILSDSGSRAIFVENAVQLDKVASAVERLPGLGHAILFDPGADLPRVEGLEVLSLAELEKRGTAFLQESRAATGRRKVPLPLAVQHAVADRLVYGKIRAAFGGNLRGSVSGSAALAADIGYFFAGTGVHVLEGYGHTETSAACTVNPADDYRVGKPLPGTEVRIAADGEILLRGPGVMRGHHNLPEKTAEVLESDGWFRTGDIGEVDKDGYARITDRKKDVLKTSGGKYVAPTDIEGRFKAICPFVSNILFIGDGRNFCSALISLDEATIASWAASQELGDRTHAEIVSSPQVHELINGFVQRVNGDLQRWQTIKKFAVLPRDLDIEHGELTPSLKIKRPVVERKYAQGIDGMYEGARET